MVLSYPEVRSFVKNCLAEMCWEHFPQTEVIAGIATAGIAHGALMADTMQLPNCYVRPEPKKHGMKNQIEGYMAPGAKVLLVEDLISTGKSSLQAAQAVREAGGEVVGLLALFTYGFEDAAARFAEAKVPFYTISNFSALVDVAVEHGYLEAEKLDLIKQFAQNPSNWKP
jgi:orotate phosphoribosyltransferase